jgi:DnaJ family protein A protein 2
MSRIRDTELYDTLGISPNASISDIKKAYRKLALVFHPDKPTGDEKKFIKLSSAYEILSDENKKRTYDMYGKGGLKNSGQVPTDIFNNLFGQGPLGNIFNLFQETVRRVDNVTYKCSVSLEDLCLRKIKKIQVTRDRICPCQKNLANGVKCTPCNGQGHILYTKMLGPGMMQQINNTCNACKGRGVFTPSCGKCRKGVYDDPKVFSVHLTPTTKNGQPYKYSGDGNEIPGYLSGDFIVIIEHKKHDTFQVNGMNLIYNRTTTLKEALCGYKENITHPDGKTVEIIFEGVIKPGKDLKVKQEGLDCSGDMIVKHDIVFPETLTQEQKDKIGTILA